MSRVCSECPTPIDRRHGKAETCSQVCATRRQARKMRELRAARTPPKPPPLLRPCPYCGEPILPNRSGPPRATCGTEACKWKHKQMLQGRASPKPAALPKPVPIEPPKLELDWDMDAVADLKRRRLERAVELGSLWLLLRGAA